jgi:AcrR family transcriptional regulator
MGIPFDPALSARTNLGTTGQPCPVDSLVGVTRTRRVNRGPSAAAENRAALIDAARDVFADSGFDAPLSLIARRAGVGQGSLYRHFPDRASIALAVFEDNIAALETLAAEPGSILDGLLNLVVGQLTDSIGLIEMIDPVTTDPRLVVMNERMKALFTAKLDRARSGGVVRDDVTTDDLLLALAMLAALLARTDVGSRPAVAPRAWALLLDGLRR